MTDRDPSRAPPPPPSSSLAPDRVVVVAAGVVYHEYRHRRDGMCHAMVGGLWLHRHVWFGTPMAHLVSTDRDALLAYGRHAGLPAERLQYKPLKDPATGARRPAWHWDLVGRFLPA